MQSILIVEDETIMRESLRDWLTDSGYQVKTAETGEQALQTITEQDFALGILDLKLPGKNGIELLREVRAERPQFRGIVITAYPSIETAVEAIKEGAVDYLAKPFELNDLEKSIREILGPVQTEKKPEAVTEETGVESSLVEEAEVEEVVTIAPEEIPIHLKQGKSHFANGRYQKALKEFKAILAVALGNIEARVWLHNTKEALANLEVKVVTKEKYTVTEEAKDKYCVWMKLGVLSYRLCVFDYDCLGCEFDQSVRNRIANGETEAEKALRRQLELPGSQRFCHHALRGGVSYRICSRVFQCTTCEFAQMLEYTLEQKLVARQEAIHIKEQSSWWAYWD